MILVLLLVVFSILSSTASGSEKEFIYTEAAFPFAHASPKGLSSLAYTYPDRLTDQIIKIYLRPFTTSPLRKRRLNQHTLALGINDLVVLHDKLREWKVPSASS